MTPVNRDVLVRRIDTHLTSVTCQDDASGSAAGIALWTAGFLSGPPGRRVHLALAPEGEVITCLATVGLRHIGHGQLGQDGLMSTVTTMSLGELLSRFEPAHGTGWPDAVDTMLSDSDETNRVYALAEELLQRGRFDEPIRLREAEQDADGSWSAAVSNGMHRVCAHIVTATEDVAVTFEMPEVDDVGWWDLTWELLRPLGDAAADRLFSLGSFRLNDEYWASAESFAFEPTALRAMVIGVPQHLADEVASAYTERFSVPGAALGPSTTRWMTAADLDD